LRNIRKRLDRETTDLFNQVSSKKDHNFYPASIYRIYATKRACIYMCTFIISDRPSNNTAQPIAMKVDMPVVSQSNHLYNDARSACKRPLSVIGSTYKFRRVKSTTAIITPDHANADMHLEM